MNMTMLLAIGAGGAIGSICRFLVVGAIGALAEAMALRWEASPELRGFLVTGILGGFTTFSAFSLETMAMLERQEWMQALSYAAASVALSLLAAFAGAWGVRLAS